MGNGNHPHALCTAIKALGAKYFRSVVQNGFCDIPFEFDTVSAIPTDFRKMVSIHIVCDWSQYSGQKFSVFIGLAFRCSVGNICANYVRLYNVRIRLGGVIQGDNMLESWFTGKSTKFN